MIVLLLVLLLAQQVVHTYSTHKLINKIMSKNYYDYAVTEKTIKAEDQLKIQIDQEVPEDLGTLGDLTGALF